MSPWAGLVLLAAVCAAQQVVPNCSQGDTGVDCKMAENSSSQHPIVELETEYLCREATRVALHWRSKNVAIKGIDDIDCYYVNLYLANEKPPKKLFGEFTEPSVPYIKFFKLAPNTTYTFGIMVKTEGNQEPIEIFTKEPYTTLAKNFDKLPNVTNSNFTIPVVYGDEVRTNFSWAPVPENVCSYEIVVINRNPSFGEQPKYIISRAQDLRTVELTNLKYDSVYTVGVYATIEDYRNEGAGHVEGKPFWSSFKTPSCVDFYGWNYNICKPLPPRNLKATVNECVLDLTWDPVEHPPPSYQVFAYPSNPKRNVTVEISIAGTFHHFKASTRGMGEYIKILVAGHAHSGSSVPTITGVENECTNVEAAQPYGPHKTHYTNDTVHLMQQAIDQETPKQGSASQKSDANHSALLVLILIAGCLILITGLLGSFFGYKVYRARKALSPQPLQESCEMMQPLAKNKPGDKDSNNGGDASSVDDADMEV